MTSVFLRLIAYACAATFSPGPNNILLLSSTSRFGFRKCLPLMCGIWTGLLVIMLLCGFGCAALGQMVPQIVPAAKYAGAAYILYLAYRTLRTKAPDGSTAQAQPLRYQNGLLLQFLNVKMLVMGVAAYSGFLLPYGFYVPNVLLYGAVMTLCAGTGNLIWAVLGTLLLPMYRRYRTAVNLVTALLLFWCAWKMLTV